MMLTFLSNMKEVAIMLITNIVRNRIDGQIVINESNVATITTYLMELESDRGTTALIIFNKESYKNNFDEINKDINEFFLFCRQEQGKLFKEKVEV